ncbi:MAG: hypothetical protein EBS23_01830 [Betaproteobacteria bacterium]|nr:hypothetical protein [Betaproteobacteria bacterium]
MKLVWVFCLAVLVAALAACSAAPSRETFLAEFTIDNAHLPRFAAARGVPYVPRIEDPGIEAINDAVNAVPYVPDGTGDRWDAPARFWSRGGDCEEYALTKGLELLAQKYQGVYLVVARDRVRGIDHAVAVVDDQGMHVLDNQEPDVVSWDRAKARYRPHYAIDLATARVYRAKPAQSR